MHTPKSPLRRRSACPVNLTLETVGDAWSLLIVRDMIFKGASTYSEFLNAEEGIASNILSDRLRRLDAADIVRRGRDPADARRVVYRLTEKGIALAPVLVQMVLWAAVFEEPDIPPEMLHALRTDPQGVLAQVRAAWQAREHEWS